MTDAATATRAQRHYARFRLAQSLQATGRGDEASALFALIADEAPGDGQALLGRWARAGAPRARRGSSAGSAPTLTSRESEVLALVAGGLTDPQIGARLFISPKTASVHVSAILAKIGAANRAEAAAWHTAQIGDGAAPR